MKKELFKKIYLYFLIGFLFGLLMNAIFINSCKAYVLYSPQKSFEMTDFIVQKIDVDNKGNIYACGFKNEDSEITIVRKYDKLGNHIWSNTISLSGYCIQPFAIRCVNQNIYVAGIALEKFSSAKKHGFYYYSVYNKDSGERIALRYSQRQSNGTFIWPYEDIASIDINVNGDILILSNNYQYKFAIIKKYSTGIIQFSIKYKTGDDCFRAHIIKSHKHNSFFVLGNKTKDIIFLVGYYDENGMKKFEQEYMCYGQYNFVQDIQFDNDSYYILTHSSTISCYYKISGDVNKCYPILYELFKLNERFEIEWHKKYIVSGQFEDYDLIHFPKMTVTPYDIYISGTVEENVNIYDSTQIRYRFLIISSDKEGKLCNSYFSPIYEYANFIDIKTYKDKNIRLKHYLFPIDQQRLLIAIISSTENKSEISNFWIPSLTRFNLKFSKGWNLFSIPIIPRTDILCEDFPMLQHIYKMTPLGYKPLQISEKLEPGRAYWAFTNKDSNKLLTGMELLSLDVTPLNWWDMAGAATYPFFYKLEDTFSPYVFGFDSHDGYYNLRNKIIDPDIGKGFWVSPKDYAKNRFSLPNFQIRVNQEEIE